MATLKSWIGFLALLPSALLRAETVNFDATSPGGLPPYWLAGVTGDGSYHWAVTADPTAPSRPNVLEQLGVGKFPWCVRTNVSILDGFVRVKFKPISGREDEAGGLIWRWQDGNNYYLARANALEDNVTIYHILNGKRTEFKRVPLAVSAHEWHTLRVDFKGSHFEVSYDDKHVLDWDDTTFTTPGAVGVWTKADSVTRFDDFTFEGR